MNPIALVHLVAGILIIAISVPLVRKKVSMNRFYGFRIDEAFESEKKWYDINAYGGSLSLRWGFLFVIAGLIGIALPAGYWFVYACSSLILFVAIFAVIIVKVSRFARRNSGQTP